MRKIILLLFGITYLQAQGGDSLQVESSPLDSLQEIQAIDTLQVKLPPLDSPQEISQKIVSVVKKNKKYNNQAKISGLTYFDYTYADSVGFFDIKRTYLKYLGINAVFIDYYMLSLVILGLIHKKIVYTKDYCILNSFDKVLGDMSQSAREILSVIDNTPLTDNLSNYRNIVKNIFVSIFRMN